MSDEGRKKCPQGFGECAVCAILMLGVLFFVGVWFTQVPQKPPGSWFIPGISVAMLAVAAGAMTLRTSISTLERVLWLLLFGTLGTVEIKVIQTDRQAQNASAKSDREVQAENFKTTTSQLKETILGLRETLGNTNTTIGKLDSTSRKLDSTVVQEQDHFERVSSRMEEIEQNSIEATHGLIRVFGQLELQKTGESATALAYRFRDNALFLSAELNTFLRGRRVGRRQTGGAVHEYDRETVQLYSSKFSARVEEVRTTLAANKLRDSALDAVTKRGVHSLGDIKVIADRINLLGMSLPLRPPAK